MDVNINNAKSILIKSKEVSNENISYCYKEIIITYRPFGMSEDQLATVSVGIYSDEKIEIEIEHREK